MADNTKQVAPPSRRTQATTSPSGTSPHTPQKSTSSGSSAMPDALRSAPTLGTITLSPTRSSDGPGRPIPFPANLAPSQPSTPTFGPAPRPFTSANSINTGSTPLSTTPGGTSSPIKLTISGLTAAVAGSTSAGGGGQNQRPESIQTSSGASKSPRGGSSPNLLVVDQQQQDQLNQQQYKQQPILASNNSLSRKSRGSQTNLASTKLASVINRSRQRESVNWSYYLFLGIFLLVLLVLVITLVITKSRRS